MTFPVKYLHSGMRGAPVLSGTAGTLISMIDACLLTGFGTVTLSSLVVASGVATATVSGGDTFEEYAVILIDGATPVGLNGEQRVLSSTSTTFTFATTAPDGAATGTITAKYAPVGSWEKAFSGTNKAVYLSIDPQAHGHYLRVDDSGGTMARVVGYESMIDVDTGSGIFPTAAQMSGGGVWWKSVNSNATAVDWTFFADSRLLLPAVAAGKSNSIGYIAAPLRGFGDPIELAPGGDAWCTLLSASGTSAGSQSYGALDGGYGYHKTSGLIACPRGLSGSGTSVLVETRPYVGGDTTTSGADNKLGAFPSGIDGSLKLSKRFCAEQGLNKPPRFELPGVYYIAQSGASTILRTGDTLDGAGALVGRKLYVVSTDTSFSSPGGAYLVDITGPWR